MTTPNVTISKNVFTTGQAPADTTGILAVVAASSDGEELVPTGFSRSDLAVDEFGHGPLTEFGAYDLAVANKPFVALKCNTTYPGSFGTIDEDLASGSTTVSAGTDEPFDTYHVRVDITGAGTAGVAGIKYTYSLDGGENTSGEKTLGATTTLTIPNSGVEFTLSGEFVVGDSWEVYTERPLADNDDVVEALEVLGQTRIPFEGVLIDCSASSSTVGLIDLVLASWEQRGVFKFALINSRYKDNPQPDAESEGDYADALDTLFSTQTSIRICVGADGAHVPSSITGNNLKRPTSMLLAARAMAIPIGEDPAFVGRGALPGAKIDYNGNPFDHDEELYPTLDGLRLTTLRSFAPGGPEGVYVCNANTIQPTGGAFPYLQHIRIMNRLCEVAWSVLARNLSRGVRKNPKKDPVTGAVTMFEPDAAFIESQVNEALFAPARGQVSDYRFSINRADDLSANAPRVNGVLSISSLIYIKGFAVQAQFEKTISAPL